MRKACQMWCIRVARATNIHPTWNTWHTNRSPDKPDARWGGRRSPSWSGIKPKQGVGGETRELLRCHEAPTITNKTVTNMLRNVRQSKKWKTRALNRDNNYSVKRPRHRTKLTVGCSSQLLPLKTRCKTSKRTGDETTDLVRGANHAETGRYQTDGGVGGRPEVGRQQLGRLIAVVPQRTAEGVQRRRRHLLLHSAETSTENVPERELDVKKIYVQTPEELLHRGSTGIDVQHWHKHVRSLSDKPNRPWAGASHRHRQAVYHCRIRPAAYPARPCQLPNDPCLLSTTALRSVRAHVTYQNSPSRILSCKTSASHGNRPPSQHHQPTNRTSLIAFHSPPRPKGGGGGGGSIRVSKPNVRHAIRRLVGSEKFDLLTLCR